LLRGMVKKDRVWGGKEQEVQVPKGDMKSVEDFGHPEAKSERRKSVWKAIARGPIRGGFHGGRLHEGRCWGRVEGLNWWGFAGEK